MSSHIRLANAPCSWGVLEFDQFVTAVSYSQVLREIADAGYAGTELGDWGFMPTEGSRLRRDLQRNNLDIVGGFVQMPLCIKERWGEGIAQGLRVATLFCDAGYPDACVVLADDNGSDAARTANAGRISGMALSSLRWDELVGGVVQFSKSIFDATGIRTVFHHHCAGFVETPGEVEKLLSLTSADELMLCIDTGHYAFGGGSAEAACILFGERIGHVHYKDCSPTIATESRTRGYDYFESVRRGIFCELGKGVVDFAAVTAQLRAIGYSGWIVVEQDVLPGGGAPMEYARRNREYLQQFGL